MSAGNNGASDAPSPSSVLLDSYVLSSQVVADGEPVRCVVSVANDSDDGADVELLSGSEGGIVSRTILPAGGGGGGEPTVEIQPGGGDDSSAATTRHPHQITAILSGSIRDRPVYVTGCKDGVVRVMDGITHELTMTLRGHDKAVTSLSWVPPPSPGDGAAGSQSQSSWLVSGSWDLDSLPSESDEQDF